MLFMILIAIAILAALTLAISQDSTQQSGVLAQQTSTDQINRMLTYASALGGAIQQMVVNGENADALYTNLSTITPGTAGFDTAPNNLKLFHPLGGGITYMNASSPDANAVATSYNINPGSIITGVGCSSGTGCTGASSGHIIFTAMISALSYCQQANNILTGSSLSATPPTMNSATFATLFASSSAVTVAGGNCASCVNVARLCVTNGSGAYGFYADLLPPQYSNPNN